MKIQCSGDALKLLERVHTTGDELVLRLFFVRQGAFPQKYSVYFKGMQRSMAENRPKSGR